MIVININPNRLDIDEAYMQMAEIWALRSKANRKQVGALLVKDRSIIADGYNGLPAGEADDVCEIVEEMPSDAGKDTGGILDAETIKQSWPLVYINPVTGRQRRYALVTKKEVLHAESNCLSKISSKGGLGAEGATLYVTLSPCFECAKLIKQAGIKRVVYREKYRDDSGPLFLTKRKVEVIHLPRKD